MFRPLPILTLFFPLLLLASCKKKPEPGQHLGFVTSPNGVVLYASPGDFRTKNGILKEDETFQILQDSLPDPKLGEKKFWYEVQGASGTKGFFSYDESLINKTVSIFTKPDPHSSWGIITATQLNVRVKPDLASPVKFQISQFSLCKILSKGSLVETVKGQVGNWVQVESEDGRQGFAFSAYINFYPEQEAKEAQERKEVSLNGFAFIKEEPLFLSNPGGNKVKQTSPEYSCGELQPELFPKKGGFGQVTSKAMKDGKGYFLIEVYESQSYECSNFARGWIEDSMVVFYSPESFSQLTIKQPNPSLTSKDIAALQYLYHSGINFTETFLEPITTSGSGSQLYVAYVAVGLQKGDINLSGLLSKYILRRGEASSTILSNSIEGNFSYKDLDKDGMPEILAETSTRGGSDMALYGYKAGRYSVILEASYDGYSGRTLEFLGDDKILETNYEFDEKENMTKEEFRYQYSKGNLKML